MLFVQTVWFFFSRHKKKGGGTKKKRSYQRITELTGVAHMSGAAAAKGVVVVSNNYRSIGRKWPLLLEGVRVFARESVFQPLDVVEVKGSSTRTVLAAARGYHQVMWVSSGSDSDPSQESAQEVQATATYMVEKGHPCLLICWAFECWAWAIDRPHDPGVVRVVPAGHTPRNTHHRWRGHSVVASHQFAVVPGRRKHGSYGVQYYRRAGGRVVASLSGASPSFLAVQFHPECSAPLLQSLLLQTSAAVWWYPVLVRLFGLRSLRGTPTWKIMAQHRPENQNQLSLVALGRHGATNAASARKVLRAAVGFVRQLQTFQFPQGAGPPHHTPTLYLFLTSDPTPRTWPTTGWPGPSDINAGFQPSGTPFVFSLRAAAQEQVTLHELAHVFLPDNCRAIQKMMEWTYLHQPSLRLPLEGYCETLTNLVGLLGRSGRDYSDLILFLRARCCRLSETSSGHEAKKSPVLSYFRLRLQLLLQHLPPSRWGGDRAVRLAIRRLLRFQKQDVVRAARMEDVSVGQDEDCRRSSTLLPTELTPNWRDLRTWVEQTEKE